MPLAWSLNLSGPYFSQLNHWGQFLAWYAFILLPFRGDGHLAVCQCLLRYDALLDFMKQRFLQLTSQLSSLTPWKSPRALQNAWNTVLLSKQKSTRCVD